MHKTFSSLAGPESEPDAGHLSRRVLALIVAGRRCQREIQGLLRSASLTDSQLLVLWMVNNLSPPECDSEVGQSELVRGLGLSAAQISGLVEQLRRGGDLIRARAEQDRRHQRWRLTAAGAEKLQQALALISGLNPGLLDGFALVNFTEPSSASVIVSRSTTTPGTHRGAA